MTNGEASHRVRGRSRAIGALTSLLLAASAALAAPPEFAPAVAAAERGDLAACRAEFEKIAAAAPQAGLARRALYGGAVCAAQGGERDAAFALLERAVALGFHDKDRFYFDPRLQALRVDARWPELERKLIAAYGRWWSALDPELASLARQDQEDRRPGVGEIDWSYVAPRDRERCRRVRELVTAGRAKTPDDRYHAALVLQHSEEIDDYQLAHQLAKSAAEADADLQSARWLAAAALDRWLVQSGRPQKYGTQSIRKEGRWSLAEVDPAVSDAERALWDVPPLAESRSRTEAMNEPVAAPPATAAAEKPRGETPPPR